MDKRHLNLLTLDELAKRSSWPSRLLSLTPYETRHKTPESIEREFGNDKWGKLYQYFSQKNEFTLVDVEAEEQNIHKIVPCFDNGIGFYSTTMKEANKRQIEIFKNNLIPYIKDASCLVELGAGYGSKLLSLSEINPLDKLPLFAAEYTQSGCNLIKLICKKIKKNVKVGSCDFDQLSINDLEIPKNSIIFTSYSVHYVNKLKKNFVEFIAKLRPKAVVHFEPCYEYFDENSLHGLMCKRYMELNGYTQNIASAIEGGCLEIEAKFKVERNVFGTNPFLPFTIIKWFPK
jgi:hypothetical protein